HHLAAHQRERGVAAVADDRVEILDQLFAALAGIDAAALQQHRPVEAMPAAEYRAARRQVRREDRRPGAFAGLLGGLAAVLLGRIGHPRIWIVLWKIDTDADDFFEQRPIRKRRLHETVLAVGVVHDRGRPAEDFLEYPEVNRRLVVR